MNLATLAASPGLRNRSWPAWLLALSLWALSMPLRAEGLTLNLKDAEIGAVIATVSEMTGRNFIVDPRVKGRVTVISSHPMDADELYQVFLAILNVHGFAAVPGDAVTKIVPEVGAKQEAVPTVGPGSRYGEQIVTRVLHVNNVAAAQLVPILRPLLPQGGHLAAYPPSNVLIVSATDLNVQRVADLVASIDLTNEADSELIPLQHASAAEIERILNALSQGGGQEGGAREERVRVVADNRTNSVILSGSKSARQHLKKIIARLDTPLHSAGNTRVIYLNYAKATDLAQVLTGIGQSIIEDKAGGQRAAGTAAAGKTTLNIQADASTNALVINAPTDVMRDLEAVVRQLDVRRAQVLVRAVIAEVSTDSSSELGVQWALDSNNGSSAVGLIDFNNTLLGLAGAVQGLASPPALPGLSLAAADFRDGDFRFGALLRALRGDANNNILSTPSLVTMDNEEAEIVVGQNVPFITGSYTATGTASTPQSPFQTIERQDVGLTLRIRPQINEGDAIRMEITQEVSSLSAGATGASDLITNKRAVRTTVMVDDGKMLVLGGLIDEQQIESSQRVPLLGDIPVLGHLFRYQTNKSVKQDLMIFLHPRIMRDEVASSSLTTGKYNYIRARQVESAERAQSAIKTGKAPLLPAIENFLNLPPPFVDDADLALPPSASLDEWHGRTN